MISPEIYIEGVADDARERASYVVLIELLDIHHRCVILSGEPHAVLPTLTPSSSVATRHSASKLASALAAPSVCSANVAQVTARCEPVLASLTGNVGALSSQPKYFAYSIIKRIFALKNWHMCHKFVVLCR